MAMTDADDRHGGAQTGRFATIYALALLALIQAFNYFDRAIIGLVLPLIKQELVLSDTMLGLITGFAFALFNVLLTIPIARLADRGNRRNIIAIGLGFWSLMTAATGLVTNVWQLAATRFLMGAGEAAGVAPSNSIVADLFHTRRRTLAISLLTAGSPVGTILFIPIAAIIAEHYGWRATFVAAGVPGVLLAALLVLTVKEPKRETAVAARAKGESFGTALKFLMGSRTYLYLLLAGTMMSANAAIANAWWASFLTRTHHMAISDVGMVMGPVRGVVGLLALVLAGLVTDALSRRDSRWAFWLPAIAALAVAPATAAFLLSESMPVVVGGIALATFFTAVTQGPAFAACSLLAPRSMRSTAVAVFLFAAYLIGFAAGPLLVGLVNDHLLHSLGEGGIRYSLMAGVLTTLVAAFAFLFAARGANRDFARAA